MNWDNFQLDSCLIGDVIATGSGYYQRDKRFILLPKNEIYEDGYGFYVNAKLAGKTSVSIPDDLKIELQMFPDERVAGQRYKRYKLAGKEIKDTIFFPYQEAQAEQEKRREAERQQRNKRVIGNIVYGRYVGNHYEGVADSMHDVFFFNGKRYYNPKHQKVQNVRVSFPIIEGVSKHFFDRFFDFISERLANYHCLTGSLEKLKDIKNPTNSVKDLISQLEDMVEKEPKELQVDLAKALSEQEGNNGERVAT